MENGNVSDIASHNRRFTALPGRRYESVLIHASHWIKIAGELRLPSNITARSVTVLSGDRQLLTPVSTENPLGRSDM